MLPGEKSMAIAHFLLDREVCGGHTLSRNELESRMTAAEPFKPHWLARLFIAPEVLAVVRSLRDDAESWNGDAYYWLVHPNGVRVWRGNRSYGLEIALSQSWNGGRKVWVGERKVWGGGTVFSSFGLSLSHHVLDHAIKRWERRCGTDSVAGRLFPFWEAAQ